MEYEAAGYYRPRETKERAVLVEAYRKRDLINGEYKCMSNELIADRKQLDQCHFVLLEFKNHNFLI